MNVAPWVRSSLDPWFCPWVCKSLPGFLRAMSSMSVLQFSVVAKRSLSPVTTYIIIASSVGGVFILLATLTLWLVIRWIKRRRRRMQVRISGPLTVEHEEARQALRLLAHAKHPSIISAATEGFTAYPQRRSSPIENASKVPAWRLSGVSISTASSKSKEIQRPAAGNNKVQKPIAVVATTSVLRNASRRSLDAETASIYSSMSAPIDYHEKLFSTPLMVLDPSVPVSAPAWITTMASQQHGAQHAVITPVAIDPRRPPPRPPRHARTGSTRRSISTRQSNRLPPISAVVNPTYTSIPAWSRRTEAPPPTRIQWRVPATDQNLQKAATQPVADIPSLPSPPPATYPSIAPLNVRSKTTRNDSDLSP
ncbi:hypothetical protein BC629DRAFT_887529 [Irpex lacteus]|nr:hypothetical protein BC629DRAFT_887529 [Irpex lacteus]